MAKGTALTPPLPACGERYGEGLGVLNPNEPIKRKTLIGDRCVYLKYTESVSFDFHQTNNQAAGAAYRRGRHER